MVKTVLGIIGGSGIYEILNNENGDWHDINTPWGQPSDQLYICEINSIKVCFLPRHGRNHTIPPSEINYQANIAAMKISGVTDLISLSACGSLREDLSPGTFVFIDQFIDRTINRKNSFFGSGCVTHVSLAYPISPLLQNKMIEAAQRSNIDYYKGGTYLAIEGPQFSTLAESKLYQSWNCDVIGMTNMPEAKLAREAEICYSTAAMVTDYDCWHPDHGEVDIPTLLKIMHDNSNKAVDLVSNILKTLPKEHEECPIGSDKSLEWAIITAPEKRNPEMVEKLKTIANRVL